MTKKSEEQLIARYIETYPEQPSPHEARIRDFGVPIWALVGHLEAIGGDVDQVAVDYALPIGAVQAALAYYRRHKAVIDARIALNAA